MEVGDNDITNDLKSQEPKQKKVLETRGRKPKDAKNTKLKQIMVSKGMTLKDLEAKVVKKHPESPISRDSLSKIINGKRDDYMLSTLFRICDALNVTPNDILDYDGNIK